ncbi:helix-turn-helix domain-containing protein [Cutibacterium equinum]|uniref:Helix-turn-helix domain-containing protein n=1 Tax=Cutibacterium equinum TaxID=3016342 RepID=A0ABY7QW54_9ACTN|nr:helix-turn-helix domain-containing protein [Cutibacterium equinum]WCC79288.1 helix-turn-helix domain-containing protein [Cutibacterium equinum]
MVTRAPRLVGQARQAMAEELAGRYNEGASIRSLARESGRSYGLVQRLLQEAGVQFRPRGGADPASPQTKAERETVEQESPVEATLKTSATSDQQDKAAESAQDHAGDQPDVEALRLAIETAVARAEKADRKARKAEKALRKLRRKGAKKSRRKEAKATLDKHRAKAEKADRKVRKARRRLDEAEHAAEPRQF